MSAHAPSSIARRRLWPRLLLMLASPLCAAALIEVVLRLLGLVMSERRLERFAAGATHILCIGDSHTYGVYFPAAASYPKQLERALNAGRERPAVSVVNGGMPGANTERMLATLAELMQASAPEIVVLLGGVNNSWNGWRRPTAGGRREPLAATWWRGLRVVKLIELLAQPSISPAAQPQTKMLTPDTFEVTTASGKERVSFPRLAAAPDETELKSDITRALIEMVNLVRQGRATPVLLTYAAPDRFVAAANQAARIAADKTGALLCDLETRFRELIPAIGYEALLIPNDYHPTERGYHEIATVLARCLIDHGLVPVPKAAPPPFAQTTRTELTLTKSTTAAAVELCLEGPPNTAFMVLLSTGEGARITLPNWLVPASYDLVFARALKLPFLRGDLGADGRAKVSLPGKLLSGLPANIGACAVAFSNDPALPLSDQVIAVSARIALP